jgi:hypothetical protein
VSLLDLPSFLIDACALANLFLELLIYFYLKYPGLKMKLPRYDKVGIQYYQHRFFLNQLLRFKVTDFDMFPRPVGI